MFTSQCVSMVWPQQSFSCLQHRAKQCFCVRQLALGIKAPCQTADGCQRVGMICTLQALLSFQAAAVQLLRARQVAQCSFWCHAWQLHEQKTHVISECEAFVSISNITGLWKEQLASTGPVLTHDLR
jgi:hypothetical protein